MWRLKRKRPRNPLKPRYRSKREVAKAAYPAARKATREAVWTTDGGRCLFPTCRRFVTLAAMHAHEFLSRAQGGSPTDPDNVGCLCGGCHHGIHTPLGGKTKRITGTRATGLRFFEKREGQWVDVSGMRVEG